MMYSLLGTERVFWVRRLKLRKRRIEVLRFGIQGLGNHGKVRPTMTSKQVALLRLVWVRRMVCRWVLLRLSGSGFRVRAKWLPRSRLPNPTPQCKLLQE